MSSSDPWIPEIDISPAFVRARLAESFPEFAVTSVELLGRGWDNAAYLVNQQWVFRFPCREVAAQVMAVEVALLPAIQEILPLTIPTLEFICTDNPNYGWPFSGYKKLSGETACRLQMNDDERLRCAIPLAQFLKVLHSEQLFQIGRECNIPGDIWQKSDPSFRVSLTLELFDALAARNVYFASDKLRQLVQGSEDIVVERPSSLVHGDFYVRHLIIDNVGELSGIIDWGDVHIGQPALDLSIVYSFLPVASHDLFWQHYGEVSTESKRLAKLRAIYSAVMLIDYGDKINDQDLVREGLYCLARFH
ncbi:MAG: phosphotransferase [Coxiellaceae bacterium]|nr:phosphotransferase [Coxiellaceae bacterium]